jgi:hypothetical protein
VGPQVLQGGASLARRFQRLHQVQCRLAVQRVPRSSADPPAHRLRRLTPGFGFPGQLFQPFPIDQGQARPPGLRPLFQLSRAIQMNSIEEGTLIQVDRLAGVAGFQRDLEPRHVALDQAGIEAEVILPQNQVRGFELVAQGMDGLLEGSPGALDVAVRPK